ncbi:hypothetical protein D6C82_10513 [Aureobasidium pullulans]|nr:hypothetical protein D6C82_10513 [Aureobasidium pullulans]
MLYTSKLLSPYRHGVDRHDPPDQEVKRGRKEKERRVQSERRQRSLTLRSTRRRKQGRHSIAVTWTGQGCCSRQRIVTLVEQKIGSPITRSDTDIQEFAKETSSTAVKAARAKWDIENRTIIEASTKADLDQAEAITRVSDAST